MLRDTRTPSVGWMLSVIVSAFKALAACWAFHRSNRSAGIYSCGVVIYEPFWHPPVPEWVAPSPGGELPTDKLIQLVMQAKGNCSPPFGTQCDGLTRAWGLDLA